MPVSNVNIPIIKGEKNFQTEITNNNKTNIPHLSRKSCTPCKRAGKKLKSILDPSKGGIGNRLNTANTILINTIDILIR